MRIIRLLTRMMLIASILFLLLSLSTCTPAGETGKQHMDGNTLPAQLPPYHILWYHINAPQKDTDLVLNEVNKYLKDKINATLEIRMIDWQNYDKEIDAVIASGEPYDICFTTAYNNSYIQNASNGAFAELDPLLDKYGRGILEILHPLFLDGVRFKGKIYAVPANKELAHQNALIFNSKYVKKYGFDLSKVSSLYDIEPMLKVIKEKETDAVPYAIQFVYNNSFSLPFDKIIENIPGALYYDNRTGYKIINQFETPEYKKYFAAMHRWYQAGYIPKEAAFLKQLNEYEKNGNWFASAISGSPHSDITLNIRFGYKADVIPLQKPIIENRDCQGSMLAISRTSKNPQRAMMFLNLLNTDPYLHNLIVFGIEGKHYTKKTDKVFDYPEGITQHNASYMIAPFTAGNMMIGYIPAEYPLTIWDDYRKFSESAIKAPLLGFNFNPAPVAKEISALQSVSNEFYGLLVTGAVNPDIYLPKAMDKYKSAGLQKVMEEEQRQLDAWLASKRKK